MECATEEECINFGNLSHLIDNRCKNYFGKIAIVTPEHILHKETKNHTMLY